MKHIEIRGSARLRRKPASASRLLLGAGIALFAGAAQAQLQGVPDAAAAPAAAVPQGQGDAPVPVVAAPAAPAAAAGSSTRLEEVVVTATKRAQSVRDVPSTINVVTGAKLEARGARDLKDFIDLVPGIKMAEQTADTPRKIAVRGVGPDDTTNQTVGTVFADVPLSDPYGSYTVVDPDPWDLQTVEVLKGPQGTLFGASSLAGLIRYVPNAPDLGAWEGKAFADWTSIKEGGTAPTFGAALNVPIGSTLALRASGVVQHDPGVIDIDTPTSHRPNADFDHKWSGRMMALWKPLPRLTVNALYLDQQYHADEQGFVTNSNGVLERNDEPSTSPTHRAFSLATLDLRYAFDWATLVSVSGHQHKVNDFDLDSTYTLPGEAVAQTGLSVTRGRRDVEANGFVQELRLVSPDGGPWTWMAGGFYSAYRAYLLSDIYVTDSSFANGLAALLPPALASAAFGPDGISAGYEIGNPLKAGERAVFGELTRKLGPVDITLGGRLYRTIVDGEVQTGGILYTLLDTLASRNEAVSVEGKGFSPKLAVTWHLDRDVLFYASASKGFQFGGINILAANVGNDPTTFKSSTLWNYEGGVRTDWFDRTLRADLTAFYIDWRNAQVTEEDAADINTYVSNVGAVRSRGFESSLRYLFPLKGLSLEVSGAYTEARTTVPYINGSGTEVNIGTIMPNSPTVQTASTLAYRRLFGPWRTQSAVEYTHSNTSWNDIEHDHLLDARNTWNLNFGVTRSDVPLSPTVSVVVYNLTDEKKVLSYRHGQSTFSAVEGTPVVYERPRTLELRISADF